MESLYNKVTGLPTWRSATLLKKKLRHSCFPVNITKCLRTAFCMEHLRWLLLKMVEEEFIRNSSCFNNLRKGSYTEEFIRNSSSKAILTAVVLFTCFLCVFQEVNFWQIYGGNFVYVNFFRTQVFARFAVFSFSV